MCRAWALKGNFNPSSEFYGKEIYSRNIQIIGPPPSSHLHQSPPPPPFCPGLITISISGSRKRWFITITNSGWKDGELRWLWIGPGPGPGLRTLEWDEDWAGSGPVRVGALSVRIPRILLMVILGMNNSIGEGHRIIFISIGFTFGQLKINKYYEYKMCTQWM